MSEKKIKEVYIKCLDVWYPNSGCPDCKIEYGERRGENALIKLIIITKENEKIILDMSDCIVTEKLP